MLQFPSKMLIFALSVQFFLKSSNIPQDAQISLKNARTLIQVHVVDISQAIYVIGATKQRRCRDNVDE
jgi:hypothetical protein